MAHELTFNGAQVEFAYTGAAPWHGLGTRLPEAATREDMIRTAGLDWVVLPEEIRLTDGTPISGYRANVRSDTREVLGVVSNDYQLVQNGQAFQFVDDLVSTGGARYYTAGSVRRGRQVFATAKFPREITVVPGDVCQAYLLMLNAHDGSRALHLRWTTVRVVCNNTLTAAMGGTPPYEFTVRHMGQITSQLDEARRALGIADRYFDAVGDGYRWLASQDLSAAGFQRFLDGFIPVPSSDTATAEAAARERERTILTREKIRALFEAGAQGPASIRGTAWAAYNAATEWVDHVRTAKMDGTMRAGSAEAAVLGVGQDLRNRAMTALLAAI